MKAYMDCFNWFGAVRLDAKIQQENSGEELSLLFTHDDHRRSAAYIPAANARKLAKWILENTEAEDADHD